MSLLVPLIAAPEGLYPERSPRAKVSQMVGTAEVTVDYGRPRVNGRTIWGAVVPYGQRWRAGANQATTIRFAEAVTIYGRKVPAGTYSLFMFPDREQWAIVLDRRSKIWGAGEEQKPLDEVLRIYRKPRTNGTFTEWLTYTITPSSLSSSYVALHWERLEVDFLVEVDMDAFIDARIRKLQSQSSSKDWEPLVDAAFYLWDQGRDLDRALELVNRSVAIKETPRNLYVKAQILRDRGHPALAWSLLEKADQLARTTKAPAKWTYPIQEALSRWRQSQNGQPRGQGR